MKRIIYSKDGGLCVVVPSPEFLASFATENEAMAALIDKDVPANSDAEIINVSSMPTDRTFRGAWEKSGSVILHNIEKCKIIAHEKRRVKRDKLYEPLDKLATSSVAAIKNKAISDKQAVYDADAIVQANIDAATTPDELKTILAGYGAL